MIKYPKKGVKMTTLMKFIKDDEGVTMIEYGLMAALIAVALIATLLLVQGSLIGIFDRIRGALDGA
jgi:pilus assembly protein Flp/PilA